MEKSINWWKIALCALVVLLLMGTSFYLGRRTTKEKVVTKIEYIKGGTIRDTVNIIKPVNIISPVDTIDIIKQCVKDGIYAELFPTKTEYIEVSKADTSEIIKDWATRRFYQEKIFANDTTGECIINTEVQYNRMKVLGYEYTPVAKTITNTKYLVKYFTPFIGVGVSTMPSVNAEFGFFINQSWGFSFSGDYYFNHKQIANMPSWSVGVKILKEF